MRSMICVVSVIVACSSLGGVMLWATMDSTCRCCDGCSPKSQGIGYLATMPLSVRNVTKDTLTLRQRVDINWRWIHYYHGR